MYIYIELSISYNVSCRSYFIPFVTVSSTIKHRTFEIKRVILPPAILKFQVHHR